MKIANIIVADNVYIVYEKEGIYYMKDTSNENKEIKTTKLHIASLIGTALRSSKIFVEKRGKKYIAKKYIIVYDSIEIELFYYSDEKNKVIRKLEELYNMLIDLNDKYEANQERNMRKFMGKIHKFAYFDAQVHYFEDNTKDFRELVVEAGIPNDARADFPIFGYANGNQLVIFKNMFFKGDKQEFLEFIDKNKMNIAKHYGLKSFKL